MTKLGNKRYVRLMLILFMAPLTGATVDIYVPSLPSIAHVFQAPISLVQFTIPVYLLGYSVSQIFCGSLSDAIGRRPILLFGLILYIVASLLAPLSPNISTLIAIRFLQGIAVAAPGVLSRAITSDSFSREEIPVITNYIVIAWAVGPILAPMVGSYLQTYFSWHAPFYFLAAYGLINLVFIAFLLPETNQHFHAFKLNVLFKNYRTILSHSLFVGGALVLAIVYGFIILFNVIGPFLIQKELGYSPLVYGRIALLLGFCWFLGGLLNRWAMKRFSMKIIALTSMSITLFLSIIMWLIAVSGHFNLWALVIPTALMLVSCSTTFAICFGKVVSIFPSMGGTASSAMGSLFIAGAGLAGVMGSLLKADNQIPLACAYVVLIVAAIAIYFLLMRKKLAL